MNSSDEFFPPRRAGLIVNGAVLVVLAGAGSAAFWLAVQQRIGSDFILLLLAALVLLAPVPVVFYHGYALLRASYTINRDGLRLRWGLRGEDIPLPEIEWVRPVGDLAISLPLPLRRWPGAFRGMRQVAGLGPVEFMASEMERMLMVATSRRIFVISPADPAAFMRAFQRAVELGSLSPLPGATIQTATFIRQVWRDIGARILILSGFGLNLGLFVLVSLIIPGRNVISIGYDPQGVPQTPGPVESLLLLPVLGMMVFVFNLLLGLFQYRQKEHQPKSYLLWASTVGTSILLIVAAVIL